MRRTFLFLLIGVLLTVSVSSYAEYKGYQLTAADPYGDTTIYPLDAHNVIVRVRCYSEEYRPWHVTWYRDGEIYRDLEGTGPRMDHEEGNLCMPKPAGWDGEELSMSYCTRKRKSEYVWGVYGLTPDPENYETYLAQWTENGLEQAAFAPESWFGSFDNGRITVSSEENAWRIRYANEETLLPKDGLDGGVIAACIPVGERIILLKIVTRTSGAFAVCLDHGQERYRVALPQEETIEGRLFIPDINGGFFCVDGYRPGDYSPMYLMHYWSNGQPDRKVELSGRKVVVNVCASAIDPGSGLCTLYGTAAANSRKVYTAFAMTLDEDLNVIDLDVRKIDPEYGCYDPMVFTAPDGTAWVYINDLTGKYNLWPVLIPFSMLQKSRNKPGITVK